jgi:RNA polymerase-associated protein CTR9
MELLRTTLDSGDIDATVRVVDEMVRSAADDTAVFNALCVRAAIHAMQDESIDVVRKLWNNGVAENALGTEREAMMDYIEGTTLVGHGAFISAMNKFKSALKADRHFVLAQLGIAVCHFNDGEFRKCFEALTLVLTALGDLSPAVVRTGLGICSFRLEKYDHAEACFARALQLDGDDTLARMAMFAVQVRKRNLKLAAQHITKLYQAAPSTVVVQKFADVLFFKAVADNAVAAQEESIMALINAAHDAAVEAGDKKLAAYCAMQNGRVQQALRRHTQARDLYSDAIAADPALLSARIHLAEVTYQIDGVEQSLASLLSLQEDAATEKKATVMIMTLLSVTGNHSRAVRYSKLLTTSLAVGDATAWSASAWANRLVPAAYSETAANTLRMQSSLSLPADASIPFNVAVMTGNADDIARTGRAICGGYDVSSLQANNFPDALTARHLPVVLNFALAIEKADAPRARAIYRAVVKRFPGHNTAFFRLIDLCVAEGNVTQGLRWAALLLQAHPTDDGAVSSIAAMLGREHSLAALAIVKPTAGRSIARALSLGALFLSDAQKSVGKKEQKLSKAIDLYRYVLRQDGENVLAMHGIACCVGALGDAPGAAMLLNRVSETQCNDAQTAGHVVDNLFTVLVRARSYEDALSLFRAREKLTPAQLAATAQCHARLGHYAVALATLRKLHAGAETRAAVAPQLFLTLWASLLHDVTKVDTLSPAQVAELEKRHAEVTSLRGDLVGDKSVSGVAKKLDRFDRQQNVKRIIAQLGQRHAAEDQVVGKAQVLWRQEAAALRAEEELAAEETQAKAARLEQMRAERSAAQFERLNQLQRGWNNGASGFDDPAAEEAANSAARKREREEDEDAMMAAMTEEGVLDAVADALPDEAAPRATAEDLEALLADDDDDDDDESALLQPAAPVDPTLVVNLGATQDQ